MDLSQQKELFSNAYIRAVAAVAGYACYRPEPDTDSVDLGIAAAGAMGTTRSPRVELQLKCSARGLMDDTHVRYPLKVKNYNELRGEDFLVPRILVVVMVPDELDDWLQHSEHELAMRHCGYWASLRECDETENRRTVTVPIPREQQFTADALQQMLNRIANGGLP